MKFLLPAIGFSLIAAMACAESHPSAESPKYDYPTTARVDYVIGCMATNGQSRLVMEKCACSIDVIASQLPYNDYVEAETAMAMQGMPGERYGIFRDVGWIKDLLDRLRLAQVEADMRCF